jgi:hypothetical protein
MESRTERRNGQMRARTISEDYFPEKQSLLETSVRFCHICRPGVPYEASKLLPVITHEFPRLSRRTVGRYGM